MVLICLGAVILLFLVWVFVVAVRRDRRDRARGLPGSDGGAAARAQSQGRIYTPGNASRGGQ
ncbi:MAG TPA: hypothetical protein VMB79_17220 [Jatrophihabitans sp.]|nr:hypothetical protein [Jatrophihabitans sp.]